MKTPKEILNGKLIYDPEGRDSGDGKRMFIVADDAFNVPASALALPFESSVLQPIADLPAYLRARKPVAHYLNSQEEQRLWMRLPSLIAKEVRVLLDAFDLVNSYRRSRLNVQRACLAALEFYSTWNWHHKTFRAKYERWLKVKDWFVLVNRAKAGAEFQEREANLSPKFVAFVVQRFAEFKRDDGKRQAIMSIKRQWRTGLNPDGAAEVMPGYEDGWEMRNPDLVPWSDDTLRRAVKKTGKFTRGVRALLHEGESAARSHLPQVLTSRKDLRFFEWIEFDDVRTDWLILNTATGKPEELWLLVARDLATGMVLGFVMHPATVREDGTATHLGLKQVKQLCGFLLERYPLPPYVVTWKVERGTATLSQALCDALGELLGNRIRVSFSSMIGGTSPTGYAEKKKGNSRGKASLESHNRLLHTQGAFIMGQTGARYEIRPADLLARGKEAVEIWLMRETLPEHLRGREQYPLLTLNQAREYLFRICNDQNARTDHKLEGFEEKIERVGDGYLKRMESPIERAARLVQGLEWTPVSPQIICAFYEHTVRNVTVKANGEIEIQVDGREMIFRHGGVPLHPETKALAYFHPDDPRFLHLTNGRGGVLGTWIARARVGHHELDALADALRYTHIARAVAADAAKTLATGDAGKLEAMRVNNAKLLDLAKFTDVTEAPKPSMGIVGGPAGAALTAVSTAVKDDVRRQKERAADLKKFTGDVSELADMPEPQCESHVPHHESISAHGDFDAEGLLD